MVTSDTSSLIATGFEDGNIAPYKACTTQKPNYGVASTLGNDRCIEFFWTQVGYDGTRMDRGAEACSALAFDKEGWYGFKFYLPSPGFPEDKTQGIAQIFATGGCSSWASMLEVRNDELWLVHRGNCVATPQYQARLAGSVPRNAWNPIVLHFVASNKMAGGIEVWFGDAVCDQTQPTYRKMGIDFAFGTWTNDTLAGNGIGLKFGMYNFDDGNYTIGETRTIYYDDVVQLVGNPANAWGTVAPNR